MDETKNRWGRPRTETPKRINLKVRIDDKMNDALIEYCRKRDLPKTIVIRQAIRQLLEKEGVDL